MSFFYVKIVKLHTMLCGINEGSIRRGSYCAQNRRYHLAHLRWTSNLKRAPSGCSRVSAIGYVRNGAGYAVLLKFAWNGLQR